MNHLMKLFFRLGSINSNTKNYWIYCLLSLLTLFVLILIRYPGFVTEPRIYAEESIYKKFTSKEDNAVMPAFHKADWKEKFLVLQKFKDERLRYFGKKILYEESPESLPKNEYNIIHKEVATRVLSTNEERWNTIPRAYSEIDTLRNKFKDDKEKLKLLDDINIFIEEIEKSYEKTG